MRRKRSTGIITLLIALILGGTLGMLFSPTGGATMRGLVVYQVRKILQKIKTLFIHLINFHKEVSTYNNGKVASQEVINKTIEKAKKLLEEAKNLSDELEA